MLQCVIVGKPLSFVISLLFIRYRPLSSSSEIKISKRKQVSARLTQPHQIHISKGLLDAEHNIVLCIKILSFRPGQGYTSS